MTRSAPTFEPSAERRTIAVPGRNLLRQVVWLAGPVLVEQVLLYLVGLSDTILTGRFLQVEQLAAVTVASYLMWFVSSLIIVVSAGATAIVARRIGAGQRDQAIRVTHQAMLLGSVVGLTLIVIGEAAAPAMVHALNLSGPAADEAVTYLRITLAAMPLLTAQSVGVACLRGAGDTRTGMWVMVVMNAINVTVSWAAAIGSFGLPRMGLAGVALGTALAESVGGILILIALARGRAGLALRIREMRPDRRILAEIFRISLPAFGESVTNLFCQLWFLALINRLGETATAAHGVAIRCEAIAFLTVIAFSVAASTLTGQYLGAGRPDLARRAATLAWKLGAIVLSLQGLLLILFARPMFDLFLGEGQPGVADQGVPALRLVAAALPALATIVVFGGALRGAGDTRGPWLVVILGYLLIRLPLTYLLAVPHPPFGLPGGLLGAWTAMFVDIIVRGGLMAIRFHRGGWMRIRL